MSHERTLSPGSQPDLGRETVALLHLIALGRKEIAERQYSDAASFLEELDSEDAPS